MDRILVRPMPIAPKRRLNGWVRIGIVISALWVLFVCGFALSEYVRHDPHTSNFIEWQVAKTGESYASLLKTTGPFADLVPLSASLRLRWFIFALLAPVLVFWVSALAVIYTVRWVAHGFAREKA